MASLSSKLKAVLHDTKILASESELSYVNCLIPECKLNETLILHREPIASGNHRYKSLDSDDLDLSEMDITGSPLEYELGNPKVDETIVDERNWGREEEFHLPLTKSEAWIALNRCLECLPIQNSSPPILAVCDGKDKDRTVLLGSEIKVGWFSTMQACVLDAQILSTIEKLPDKLLKEYTNKYSVSEHKVRKSVCSMYELCGKRPGLTNTLDLPSGSFNGSLSTKMEWNSLCFRTPIKTSTSTLIMEISAGWNGSHLKNLWKELKLLHQYFSLLKQCYTSEENLQGFTSNCAILDEIKAKLNSLLNGESENDMLQKDDNTDDHVQTNDDIKLKMHVDNARLRQNIDFADKLWELLIECPDHFHAANCIRFVLREIQLNRANPQIVNTNSTKINKMISEILYEKKVLPIPDDNLTLQILVDTGLAKLTRDYSHVLLSANLINLYDLRKNLSHVQTALFDIESYEKNLTTLSQIHLCLEFTLFAQNYLNCPTSNLQSIFMNSFKKYVSENSPIKSFQDLGQKSLQCLEVPLDTCIVKTIAEGLPSSWCLTLSSESAISKMTVVTYLSRLPILPPNIYTFDELNVHQGYHVLRVDSSTTKIA